MIWMTWKWSFTLYLPKRCAMIHTAHPMLQHLSCPRMDSCAMHLAAFPQRIWVLLFTLFKKYLIFFLIVPERKEIALIDYNLLEIIFCAPCVLRLVNVLRALYLPWKRLPDLKMVFLTRSRGRSTQIH